MRGGANFMLNIPRTAIRLLFFGGMQKVCKRIKWSGSDITMRENFSALLFSDVKIFRYLCLFYDNYLPKWWEKIDFAQNNDKKWYYNWNFAENCALEYFKSFLDLQICFSCFFFNAAASFYVRILKIHPTRANAATKSS